MLTTDEIRARYARIAGTYDDLVKLFPAFGFRLGHYRREAVAALQLSPGATVVELGCGTGLNFPYLQRAVGAAGQIIGVDLTPEMLAQARRRVERHGWSNVQLVHSDVGRYAFPTGVRGVLSTFAITLSADYDGAIRAAARALDGGRLAILDLKLPEAWPHWLVALAARLNRPFGVTLDLAERHPWEVMERELRPVDFREHYFGALYLAVGEARGGDGVTGRALPSASPAPGR